MTAVPSPAWNPPVSFSCARCPVGLAFSLERPPGPFEGAPQRVFLDEGEGAGWRTMGLLWLQDARRFLSTLPSGHSCREHLRGPSLLGEGEVMLGELAGVLIEAFVKVIRKWRGGGRPFPLWSLWAFSSIVGGYTARDWVGLAWEEPHSIPGKSKEQLSAKHCSSCLAEVRHGPRRPQSHFPRQSGPQFPSAWGVLLRAQDQSRNSLRGRSGPGAWETVCSSLEPQELMLGKLGGVLIEASPTVPSVDKDSLRSTLRRF